MKIKSLTKRIFVLFLKMCLKVSDLLAGVLGIEKISFSIYSYLRNNETIININDIGDVNFFTPSYLLHWRVKTILIKEPETIDWIDSFNDDQEHIFWDIGANIGLYSIYAAKKHKNITVYSFEPSTSNLPILSRNISLNNLSNKVNICPFALTSNSFGFQRMNESAFEEGGALNSFGVKYGFDGKNIDTSSIYSTVGFSIDYLVKQNVIESPNHIKIDVDGIEHLIIEGGIDALSKESVRTICVELNSDFKKQYDYVHRVLTELNFNFSQRLRSEMFNDTEYNNVYNYFFTRNAD